ncbi:MAG: hypothetical protein LAQ69_41395 [Acidobacteriia bacterium]|nr:hypothetical protein [Terriglobia bacterium]
MNKRTIKKLVAVHAMTLVCGAVASQGALRIEIPEQGPGVPAYARIENPPRVIQDGTWAAIVFYRLPECVPKTFNLLSFFDAPRAFACSLTIRGFEIWKNGPPPADAGPIHAESRGLGAVPIWFVKWNELQAAIADGTLTIDELWALSSVRVGYASFFQETLHPLGSAQRGAIQIVAHGLLADGTAFQLHVASVEGQPDLTSSVKISFR